MEQALYNAALVRLESVVESGMVARLQSGGASAQEWCTAGESLLRVDPLLAVGLLERAVELHPSSMQAHYLLGTGLRLSNQYAAAEAALRHAIELDPADVNASLSLAYLLREQGRMNALAEVMMALWRHESRTLNSDRRTLAFLIECGRYAEAAEILPMLLAAYPANAEIQRRAGEVALVLGQFEQASEHLRTTLALDPEQASAWLRLAHTHRFSTPDDPDLHRLRVAAARKDLEADTQSAIGFALGKALDDLERIEEASQVLDQANRQWHAAHPWQAQKFLAEIANPVQPNARAERDAAALGIPVFIVGLPRAGTTLLETLLCRDPALRSRGELNWIDALAARVGPQPDQATLRAAGELYMRQLIQDDTPASAYIDKNPLNFRHLGLIAAMLPQARVIHCRRDLRATALSLWSQHFAHEAMAWSYDFEDIAAYTRGYRQLMAHWDRSAPLPIHHVDYETLVKDPDAVIAEVRRFLQLPATTELQQGGSTAPIATASVWQARQQVHTRSIKRWRRYAEFLPQLRAFDPL